MSNLIRDQKVVTDDPWQFVSLPAVQEEQKKQAGKPVLFKLTGAPGATPEQIATTEIPATGKVLVPLTVWLARRDSLADRLAAGELGVWLDSHELIETLAEVAPDLNVFPLLAIRIERFADGRAYSTAALARTRLGYRNELRAVGDVLRDQLYFLARVGFDAFEIRADRSAEDALAGLRDFSEPYQAAVKIDQPLWRRHARR